MNCAGIRTRAVFFIYNPFLAQESEGTNIKFNYYSVEMLGLFVSVKMCESKWKIVELYFRMLGENYSLKVQRVSTGSSDNFL